MSDVVFKYGTLIRTGPKLKYGGKWDAELDEYVRNERTNADLTISIQVYFDKINPAGATGFHADSDDEPGSPSQKKIQRWKAGEFETFTKKLLTSAQRYWNGVFWLRTPHTYHGLDWPENHPAWRCHVYCKLKLEQVLTEADAHYTIAVVRVDDHEDFRSDSVLYSQKDIKADKLIPKSTVKFWTHFHEVGHLLGLGHIGWAGHHNLHGDNSDLAYGVTLNDKTDVMGMGSIRHPWHALPWQEAVAEFTETDKDDWKVFTYHIWPSGLVHAHQAA